MSRIAPYIGAAAVLFASVCIIVFANDFADVPERVSAPTKASTTVSVLPNLSLPDLTLPSLAASATSTVVATTTSTVKKTPTPARAPEPKTPAPQTVTSTAVIPTIEIPPAATPSSGSASLDAVASVLRNALVNIICYAPAGGKLHSISGSGVIIDSKGIILTNAHIGQYFLLADKGVECSIRTGGPAIDAYVAAPIYISPAWIHANTNVLSQAAPTGTGEYDFAFLAITKSATKATLPSTFPSIPLAQLPPASGSPIVIASYGAQFLVSSQIQSALFPTIVFGSIKDVFTFATNSIDVLALGGSAAAQEGSSGGGVATASGELVGTITTSTVEGTTDTRSLDAISASYIRSAYAREMGEPLFTLLDQPTASAVADFATQIPLLESLITPQLQ